MEQPRLVHFNPVRKPDLFWMTAYALILGTGVLIGVGLAVTPLVLVMMYPSAWLLVTLAAVPGSRSATPRARTWRTAAR